VRKCDWFIPIIPPISALRAAIIAINVLVLFCRRNAKIAKGANFCHVARIIHVVQDSDVITDGNQKWNGAIPSLIKIADIRIKFMNIIELGDQCASLDISIRLEPNACAMKYLIDASVSWFSLVFVMSGMNLSILISIDIHKKSQLVLERAIIDLIIKDDSTRRLNGLFI